MCMCMHVWGGGYVVVACYVDNKKEEWDQKVRNMNIWIAH